MPAKEHYWRRTGSIQSVKSTVSLWLEAGRTTVLTTFRGCRGACCSGLRQPDVECVMKRLDYGDASISVSFEPIRPFAW